MKYPLPTRKLRLLSVVALLSIATAALAQQKYRLQDVTAARDQSDVTSSTRTTVKMTIGLMDQQFETTFSFRDEEKYREEVLAVDANGTPTAVRRSYTLKEERTKEGEGPEQRQVSSLQGKTVEVRRREGKVVVTATRGGKLKKADQESLMGLLDSDEASLFPDREVAPGDEWTAAPKVVAGIFPGLEKANLKFRFEEVVDYGGYSCARLRVTVEASGKVEDVPVPMTMSLSGNLYHALSINRTLSMDLSGRVTLKGETQEDGARLTLAGEGPMTMKLTSRWLKVAGKAPSPP